MPVRRKVLLFCLMGSCVAASASHADSATTLYADIGAQSVAEALAAFGRQTGLQLIYVSTIAETQQSKGARAGLTASEALAQLLEGTGLRFEFLNARTIRIFPAPTVVPTFVAAIPASQHSAQHAPILDEVIITARRPEEALNKVPINMAVWSQEDLEGSGIKGISDIASLTPSMQFDMSSNIGSGAITLLSIRGVSDRSASITGLYLNDTPIPPVLGHTYFRSFPLTFDLDRIEVLRGPQLQLFGEGNQGGAVRFISNQPSLSTFTALAKSELATTERGDMSYEAGAVIGGPVVRDVLGFRVSAWRRSDGGFVDRVDPFTGATVDHNANHSLSQSVRSALMLAPTDAVRISSSLTYTSYNLHDSPFFFTNLSNVGAGQLRNGLLLRQPDTDTFYLADLKVTTHLGAVDLNAVSSYFHDDAAILIDNTASYDFGSPLGPSYPLDYSDAVAAQHGYRQATFMQELRLTSADPNAALTWDTGAFYSRENLRETEHLTAAQGLPGVFPGPVNLQNTAVSGHTRLAAFGEVSVRVMKRLTVSAGVHSERTHYQAVTELAPILRSEGADSGVMPRFGLSYQAEERELIYLTVAKGYGSGGLWALLLECPGQPPAPIGMDTLWSYEAGMKSGLLDGRVQLDTGFFHIAWNNGQGYQLSNSSMGPCNSGYLGDPGAAASNGFDFAARAVVGSHVELGLALAYTDARYTRTLAQNGVVIARKGEAVGSYLPHVVSPWNVTASVDYKVALHDTTADLRAEDIFRSRNPGPFKDDDPASAYYSPGNRPDPSINLLNLRATLRWASYDVALFVNNMLDAQPLIMRCCGGYPAVNGTLRPRTVGLSASWRY